MDEEERFINAVKWQKKPPPYQAASLGQAARRLMDERISPLQARFSKIAEIWSVLLPVELVEHCEIIDLCGGQLTVQADSPSYAYELQLCSPELLKELQRQCPSVRLAKIKFVIG